MATYLSGGVAIFTQKLAACMELKLTTPLEIVAVRILTDRVIALCSLYIPPSYKLAIQELQCLLDELPVPHFNAHNSHNAQCS